MSCHFSQVLIQRHSDNVVQHLAARGTMYENETADSLAKKLGREIQTDNRATYGGIDSYLN